MCIGHASSVIIRPSTSVLFYKYPVFPKQSLSPEYWKIHQMSIQVGITQRKILFYQVKSLNRGEVGPAGIRTQDFLFTRQAL